jgi:hypothetical protein
VFSPDRLRQFWRPPVETVTGMAAVLREHWRAAARMRPARLFWPTPGRWLKVREAMSEAVNVAPVRTAAVTAPVTTSPMVAGSSDKPPDPHQY